MWRLLELGPISLWMRRSSDWLLSRPRDGQEVLPVYGKAVTRIPLVTTSMREASTNQERCQKLEQIRQRTGWLAGDWSRRCISGGQGISASQAQGREGLTMVTHPEQVGGGDSSVQLFWGEHREGKRGQVHRMQQGKFQKFNLRVEENWKGPKSLWHFHLWRYSKTNWARLWTTWSDFRVSPALSKGLN